MESDSLGVFLSCCFLVHLSRPCLIWFTHNKLIRQCFLRWPDETFFPLLGWL
jgi:hypothetical protein